ncbi:hypothetical protein BKA93DRAFT_765334, partial [Sparassis latifolia]
MEVSSTGKVAKKGKKSLHKRASPRTTQEEPADINLPTEASREQTSLTAGDFADTKFYVFSARTQSGTVNKPLAVFANSVAVRKASPHFERLLSGGFMESQVTALDAENHLPQNLFTNEYDYDSDSDLDDDEDETDGQGSQAAPLTPKSKLADIRDEENISALTFREVENLEVPSTSNEKILDASDAIQTLPRGGRIGRTVYIKDIAFRTWQAFIFYVYTGKIEFAPLKSQGQSGRDASVDERAMLSRPPRCSPKSMYRLAEKYDMKELKDLAAKDLESKLSKENILPEVFSGFTSRYLEISTKQVEFLSNNLGSVVSQLPQWIKSIAMGLLPH